jgi:phage gp45-like
MWLTQQLSAKEKDTNAHCAGVTLSSVSSVCAAGSAEHRDIPVYTPFGIESTPTAGTQILLINSDDGAVCVGSLANKNSAKPGEVKIFSQGGARITLKNDGYIELNGLVITPQGKIIETGD